MAAGMSLVPHQTPLWSLMAPRPLHRHDPTPRDLLTPWPGPSAVSASALPSCVLWL